MATTRPPTGRERRRLTRARRDRGRAWALAGPLVFYHEQAGKCYRARRHGGGQVGAGGRLLGAEEGRERIGCGARGGARPLVGGRYSGCPAPSSLAFRSARRHRCLLLRSCLRHEIGQGGTKKIALPPRGTRATRRSSSGPGGPRLVFPYPSCASFLFFVFVFLLFYVLFSFQNFLYFFHYIESYSTYIKH